MVCLQSPVTSSHGQRQRRRSRQEETSSNWDWTRLWFPRSSIRKERKIMQKKLLKPINVNVLCTWVGLKMMNMCGSFQDASTASMHRALTCGSALILSVRSAAHPSTEWVNKRGQWHPRRAPRRSWLPSLPSKSDQFGPPRFFSFLVNSLAVGLKWYFPRGFPDPYCNLLKIQSQMLNN
jgi:hypothetical protein